MKNVFGICEDNELFDGEYFISRKLESTLKSKVDKHVEKNNSLKDMASVPLYLTIIKYIVGFLTISIICGICGALDDVSLKEGYHNAPYLFYIGGVSLLIWIAIVIYSKYKREKVLQSDEFKSLLEEAEDLRIECLNDLKIPNDAALVDVFNYGYKFVNGKEKQITSLFKYINMELRMFKENDSLCLSDVYNVFFFSYF